MQHSVSDAKLLGSSIQMVIAANSLYNSRKGLERVLRDIHVDIESASDYTHKKIIQQSNK